MKMNYAVCATGLENSRRVAASLASQRVTAVEVGPRFFMENDVATLENVGQQFRSEGVTLYSLHAPFRGDYDLANPKHDDRMETIAVMKSLLEKAAAAGVSIMVIHPSGPAPLEEHSGRLITTIRSLEELVPAAEAAGVTLALENLPPEYPGNDGENLRSIMEQFNSKALGLCFDTGHAHLTGRFFENLQFMRKQLVHIHLHDNAGQRDTHLPPPFGTVHWEGFYRLLRTLEYQGKITLECSPWGDELGNGRGIDSDYIALIDQCDVLFSHWESRITFEEQQRSMDPSWRLAARTPHRSDMQL